MILLDGHSLTPKRKVPVESFRLQLKERESSATIVPADMTGIGVNSWFLDDTEPGKGIVWRVKSINTAYATETPTVTLEHVVASLKDRVMFGEVTPATITGNKNSTTCTAKQAIQYILGKSPDWTLGTFDYNVTNPYKFNGDSLFDALETVSDSLEDAWWSYDMTVYPFKLNIKRAGSSVGSEMRAGRNIRTITRTVDRGGMYTRMYPIGENDMHISGDYVSKNESSYGIVAHVETDTTISTEAELRRWANERLARHAEPTVTTEVEGVDLSKDTGEPLDKIVLGRTCRMPLPEYGTTITERITELSYPDKVSQPDVFKATLSNSRNDVTRIIADNMKQAARGGGGRGSAKRQKQDLAWFEDTNDHVAMCAIGIVGEDARGNPNWTRMAELVVDGTGIHSMVQDTILGLKWHETRFDQDERKIGMVVGTYAGGDNYIKAGEICLAINNDGSSDATIEATKIHLLGETIAQTINADYIHTKIANLPKVDMLTAYASSLKIGTHLEMPNGLYLESNGVWQVTLSGPVNNVYTLKETKLNGNERTIGTFSRAVSSWVWGGGGGKINVKALPQDQTKSVNVSIDGRTSISTNGTYTYTVDYENADGDDVSTGATKTVTVSIEPTNVERKSSGITGTNLGNFSSASGKYITMKVGGNSYYMQITT